VNDLVKGTLTILAIAATFICAAKTNWIVALVGLVIALAIIRPTREG
jgi:hypothetical protein